MDVGTADSSHLAWVWDPNDDGWERAHVGFRTTIAGPGIDVVVDHPGRHRRVELLRITGVDAIGDPPPGYDWIEISVDTVPTIHLIWPEPATERLLTWLRAAPQLPSASPIPVPGPVTDDEVDAATGSRIIDLQERTSRRGRIMALSGFGAALLIAGGVIGWTMIAAEPPPEVNVEVLGVTQDAEVTPSSTAPPITAPTTDPPPMPLPAEDDGG